MTPDEATKTIRDLATYCNVKTGKDSVEIEDGYNAIIHILRCYENMMNERNSCDYIIDEIARLHTAVDTLGKSSIKDTITITMPEKDHFQAKFEGMCNNKRYYWGKIDLKPKEEEWDLVFDLLGDVTEIYKDADYGCFVKAHDNSTDE